MNLIRLASFNTSSRLLLAIALTVFASGSASAQTGWPPTPPPYQSGNNFTVNGHVYQVTWSSTSGTGEMVIALVQPWHGAQDGVFINGLGIGLQSDGPTGSLSLPVTFDSSQPGSSTDAGDSNHLRRYIQAGSYVYASSNTMQLEAYVNPVTYTYQVTALAPYDPTVSQVTVTFTFGNGGQGLPSPEMEYCNVYVGGNPAISLGVGSVAMEPCGTATNTCTLTNHTGTLTVTLPNSGPMAGTPNLTVLADLIVGATYQTIYIDGRIEVVPTAVTVN